MSRVKEMLRRIVKVAERHRKAIVAMAIGLIVCGLVVWAVIWVVGLLSKEKEEIPLVDTMSIIEEVRPRGEIYVCSALLEDYAVRREKVSHWLWADEEHVCVQTMVQKCSYVLDLDKVEYDAVDSLKVVRVKLPQPEYVASTQSTSFMSDNSNYWAKKMTSTNGMKQEVEGKIRRSFDTAENRRKAERYAEDAIREVLRQLGFEAEFVRVLERGKE